MVFSIRLGAFSYRIMVLLAYLLLAGFFWINSCDAKNTYDSVKYTLRPIAVSNGATKLEVKASYYGKFDGGRIALNMPNIWANKEYYQQVQNVKVFYGGRDARVKRTRAKNQLTLVPTAQAFTILYDIAPAQHQVLDVYGLIIRQDLIHANGFGLFALPDDINPLQKLTCEISWQNLPNNWRYSSSHSNLISYTKRLNKVEILKSAYIAGAIRLSQIGFGKVPIFLALYGKLPLVDQEIFASLQKIVRSQNEFWPELKYPHYLISLVGSKENIGMAGTRLHQSFIAHLSPGFDIHDYKILFAHEFLHNWLGGEIIDATQGQHLRWFFEGFTDYYSRVLMFRSGSLSYKEFVGEVNELLMSYYMSPQINLSNNQISANFWVNKDIQKLPYYRGFTFAIYLNHLIKQKNEAKSLDNLMIYLLQTSRRRGVDFQTFSSALQKFITFNAATIIDKYIIKGQTISLNELTELYPVKLKSVGEYELGFELKALFERRRIKNIISSSNAYKVGLRGGEYVYGWSLRTDKDPNQIITIHKKAKIVKFMPQSNINRRAVFLFEDDGRYNRQNKVNQFFGKR